MDSIFRETWVSKLTALEIESLPISTETEEVIKEIPCKKHQAQMGSTVSLIKLFFFFFKETIQILYYSFEAEGILPNSFYEASVTIMPKLNRDIIRKLQTSISQKLT